MQLKLIIVIILFCYKLHIYGQITITGSVVDEKNHPMIGASIYIPTQDMGTITNEEGRFLLQIPQELVDLELDIHISYIGYKTKVQNRILRYKI